MRPNSALEPSRKKRGWLSVVLGSGGTVADNTVVDLFGGASREDLNHRAGRA